MYCYLLVFSYTKNRSLYQTNKRIFLPKKFSKEDVERYERQVSAENETKTSLINIIPLNEENQSAIYTISYEVNQNQSTTIESVNLPFDHKITPATIARDRFEVISFLNDQDPNLRYKILSHTEIQIG